MIIPIVLIIMVWAINLMPVYLNVIVTILLGIKFGWESLKALIKICEIGEMRDWWKLIKIQ